MPKSGEWRATVVDEDPLVEVELFDVLDGDELDQLEGFQDHLERRLVRLGLAEDLHDEGDQDGPDRPEDFVQGGETEPEDEHPDGEEDLGEQGLPAR